jgi:hypothetical protein
MKKLLLAAFIAGAAIAGGSASSADADYGPGTVYQVEISANDVDGGNFWYWAALGPGQESDYQNTDCIHTAAGGNPGGTTGASHSSGELSSWSDAGGTIEMDGVELVGGLATANFFVSDQPHSNSFTMVVTSELAPIFPLNVPLVWSGPQTEIQVAP